MMDLQTACLQENVEHYRVARRPINIMFKSDVQTYAAQNEDVSCINLVQMPLLH